MGAAVINIAIILSGLYVILSCFVSWLNETIQSAFRRRGQFLYQGVLNLLCGHDELANAIFETPFVASASNDKNGKIVQPGTPPSGIRRMLSPRTYRPSYLASRSFSLALWHSVRALAGTAPQNAGDLFKTPDNLIADLRAQVGAVLPDNPNLATALASLLNQAQDDYDKLLDLTDKWYDGQMDRVSGWYKRYVQVFIIVIAIIIVSFTGADTLSIAAGAYASPQLAEAVGRPLADIARKAMQPASNAPNETSTPEPDLGSAVRAIAQLNGKTSVNPIDNWRYHWGGMLLTIIALVLGGPFWFEVLSSLFKLNPRASGEKPGDKS